MSTGEDAEPYAPLRGDDEEATPQPPPAAGNFSSMSLRLLTLALAATLLLAVAATISRSPAAPSEPAAEEQQQCQRLSAPLSRGRDYGVSEKTSGADMHRLGIVVGDGKDNAGGDYCFPWTNSMLQWQRTEFHFQPENNWMNDPNGPVYYKGWYHLFYQYNPDGAVWGNIAWGHAVSRDLIHWLHLPLAMVPDQWYDVNGVWTGSATVLPDGKLVMLYTGSTNVSVQVQCLAVPADPDDPLLLNWSKHQANPVLLPPRTVLPKDFRDPTTAWWDPSDEAWRIVIGTKDADHAGVALLYRTKDFLSYELIPGFMHRVPATGMWECVDFYPVSTAARAAAVEASAAPDGGDGVKHVLKASMDDDRHDYYAIGSYDAREGKWTADDGEIDVGIGLRYDWGKFYAAKTFYDPSKKRRVLWGWVGETDSEVADVRKGWASLQSIPRTVLFDNKTGSNLLLWPVEEVDDLRTSKQDFKDIEITPGATRLLNLTSGAQLDIEAEFEIKKSDLSATVEADVGYNCSTGGGAAVRGMLGPFGLLVLADGKLSEQTAVYFYVSRKTDGSLRTHFCHDETRSSTAHDLVKRVVGNTVPVLDGERMTVRILVDHSIVESFAQGGRSCITSRVYPTRAIYGAARIFIFNNATSAVVTAKSISVWQMGSASIHRYPLSN